MRCKFQTLLFLVLFCGSFASAQSLRIGVLGIFHPHQLILSAYEGETLVVTAEGETLYLQLHSTTGRIQMRTAGDSLILKLANKELRAKELHAAGRDRNPVDFVLSVPGKLDRHYHGMLDVKIVDGVLVPIVTMDQEVAVASVVQAESLPGTPIEALKAQAVVSRSYFVAGTGRHAEFDFCDLTHCQFLREAPRSGSAAALATEATHGLVIQFEEKPVAAMFTRSCAGRTLTPSEIGIPSSRYPYFSVVCQHCYRSPVRWTRRVSRADAAILKDHQEGARLAVDRRLGWDAVPSNSFTLQEDGRETILEGVGQGHGVGLCQRGARAMAQGGADFRAILQHYFPNTHLLTRTSPN